MVIVVFFYDDKQKREKLLLHIAEQFPEVISLQYIINPKKNDSLHDLQANVFSGHDCLYEEYKGLRFRISAKSFFQTNTLQALTLCKTVERFASLTGTECVYDLYTGTGTLACFLAQKAKKIIGIEYINEAIRDAVINSEINNLRNIRFIAGDIKETLTNDFLQKNENPDVIITDPPRAGMHEEVTKKILKISPQKIVYVSCNPATQARDVAILKENYRIEKIQPLDMFPHTAHVECIAALVRK
jgi:23S rRNA (uracil1939-C5)-methyltransferase